MASGLVLFTFVATHLGNHALGLVSLQLAESARLVFLAFWRSLPASIAFYAAFTVHIALALAALHDRRTLRMPPLEALRLALGLAVPLLLAAHFTGTRVAHELYGLDDSYSRVVAAIWGGNAAPRQLALITCAWLHGCLGIHFVMRHRAWWRAHFHLLFGMALAWPLMAVSGFVHMATEIELLAAQDGPVPAPPDPAVLDGLGNIGDALTVAFCAVLAAVLLARLWRVWQEGRSGLGLQLSYPDRQVQVPRGWSVLEASREHGIAHLALCGGRGRCSTCRVRVQGDPAHLPPPAPAEALTLRRIRAVGDVRLACQLRPTGPISVTPLLPARLVPESDVGAEREVVVLFADLRGWSGMAEKHLPHDLSYVLDQYFAAVGTAVRAAGGVPNQFVGDSVMALFGLDCDIALACRHSLAAADLIESAMAALNERMQRDFHQSLDYGLGIHQGTAAVGEVGWRETRSFTAVGDAVNIAARLQELCRDYGVRLVVSQAVADAAGRSTEGLPHHQVQVRGRQETLDVLAVSSPSAWHAPQETERTVSSRPNPAWPSRPGPR